MIKKGFTLIELLAVVVILGVISIILTTATFKIINTVKISAFKSSAYGISEAAYLYAIRNIENSTELVVKYPSDENILKIKGKNPDYGIVTIEKGSLVSLNLYNNELRICAVKTKENSDIRIIENITAYECYIYDEENSSKELVNNDYIIDGWITIHLFYPDEAYQRMWRLSSDDGIRTSDDSWQEYLGPITIPVNRTEDVWIKYLIDSEEIIVPPNGNVLVDISVFEEKKLSESVTVSIAYDKDATEKLYKIGDNDWTDYLGDFTVTENTLIQAKVVKNEDIYDNSGNFVASTKVINTDNYFINNIGVESVKEELLPPSITRVTPTGSNVAAIEINYPSNSNNSLYKINYSVAKKYINKIEFPRYGDTVIAYYYNEFGFKSKMAIIKITTDNKIQVEYEQVNPYTKVNGSNYHNYFSYIQDSIVLAGPDIQKNPNSLSNSIIVSVNYPENANKKYIKVGNNNYTEYTGNIVLTSPTTIKAYYLDDFGSKSLVSTRKIKNFLEESVNGVIFPSVSIETNPYSSYTNSVNVSILSANASLVYYSINGYDYNLYTGPFNVTKNGTIYAKAVNANGIVIDKEYITNIKTPSSSGGYSNKSAKNNYNIDIFVTPDLMGTSSKVDEVTVSINYDSRATTKKYSLDGINYVNYTEPFVITENTTVYAVASSNDGFGEKEKVINGLRTGLGNPVIKVNPATLSTNSVEVSIEFDSVQIKKYKINDSSYFDYVGPFEVSENSKIYAYQSDTVDTTYSSYEITNITDKTTTILIDKSKYYLLKLNYPIQAKEKEYKYKEDGTWKQYKDEGILLIKGQYKNEITNGTKVIIKIENENNQIVTFNGDYYILSGETQNINETIFMRWDATIPSSPTYLIDTTGYTTRANVSLISSSKCVLTEYSIKEPGLEQTPFVTYSGPITITKNNTNIYGRCKNANEVYSLISNYRVVNIDETAPIISGLSNISTPNSIKIIANAIDAESDIYKYEFRINNGSWIKTQNNYYTFTGLTKSSSYNIEVKVTNLIGLSSTISKEVFTSTLVEPTIIVENPNIWKSSKKITLTYPLTQSSLVYQYSLDGTNWNNYNEPFQLINNTTLYARTVDLIGEYASSSIEVVMIDSTIPTINLNGIPDLVIQGTSYNLPTSYSVNSSLSGGSITCKAGSIIYANTATLAGGFYNITCKAITGAGVETTVTKNIIVSDTVGEVIFVDNIYEIFSKSNLVDNESYIVVLSNSELISIEYHLVNANKTYSQNETLCNSVPDKYMCIYKFNGDLTIENGVQITPQVRKKGLIVYVQGDLINNGKITMTAKGATAKGQNVLLYKNSNGTHEYIPAIGGIGGASTVSPNNGYGSAVLKPGKPGASGTIRKTGGGGSGAAGCNVSGTAYSGAGGSGTSYSGGAGGGGSMYRAGGAGYGVAGSSTGGAGGTAYSSRYSSWYVAGGGSGNPGGIGRHYSNSSLDVNYSGSIGTGGLLVIYTNNFSNNGSVESLGSPGGPGTAAGGSSGGGSINIFYKENYESNGTMSVNGGSNGNGGLGGTGTITIGSIGTSSFVMN